MDLITPKITLVDCHGCQACCKKQLVTLEPPEDDPAAFDCDVIEGPAGTLYSLKHKANGDCIYLGPDGCTIHGRQPVICRTFDCVAFAAQWPRARRRKEKTVPGWDEVLKAGQHRLRERAAVMTRLAREQR